LTALIVLEEEEEEEEEEERNVLNCVWARFHF
jgi:hypothetical protein